MSRKWLPSFSELIDRLSIHQLKEVFLKEHKDKYAREMQDIVHDLDLIIKEKDVKMTGDLIRCVIALAEINTHIWYNESNVRKGEEQNFHLLALTHGLNGIRCRIGNQILELINDLSRQEWKTDCLAAEFKDWDMSVGKDEKK